MRLVHSSVDFGPVALFSCTVVGLSFYCVMKCTLLSFCVCVYFTVLVTQCSNAKNSQVFMLK